MNPSLNHPSKNKKLSETNLEATKFETTLVLPRGKRHTLSCRNLRLRQCRALAKADSCPATKTCNKLASFERSQLRAVGGKSKHLQPTWVQNKGPSSLSLAATLCEVAASFAQGVLMSIPPQASSQSRQALEKLGAGGPVPREAACREDACGSVKFF